MSFCTRVASLVYGSYSASCAICRWRDACHRTVRQLHTGTRAGFPRERRDRFNYNDAVSFDTNPDPEQASYPLVTAEDLRSGSSPPRGVKLLVRDFIDDSLYNPQYGYFSKQAVILSTAEPFNFPSIKNSAAFDRMLSVRYSEQDDTLASGAPGRQLWHTPTEVFKPWYGRAIGQCLIADYMLKFFPYEDFIIYEMGAGNGTLASNILDFLKEEYPDVYDRTSYRIIEISAAFAKAQADHLVSRHSCVKIVNKSVFAWDQPMSSPCYFLATEVIDNFSHDVVRYRTDDLRPVQCLTVIDKEGNFSEVYEPVSDPLISRFLAYQRDLRHTPPALSRWRTSPFLRYVRNSLPLAPNLSPPEYIPTKLLLFLETLHRHFPLHRLLLSDFSSLPDAIPGYNAPVVQTRYESTTVPCTTYMVQPGHFDIFFPTSFEMLSELYEHIVTQPIRTPSSYARSSPLKTSALPLPLGDNFFSSREQREAFVPYRTASSAALGPRLCNVFTHKEFLYRYANLEATTLLNGENPLLDFYQNVKFLF